MTCRVPPIIELSVENRAERESWLAAAKPLEVWPCGPESCCWPPMG